MAGDVVARDQDPVDVAPVDPTPAGGDDTQAADGGRSREPDDIAVGVLELGPAAADEALARLEADAAGEHGVAVQDDDAVARPRALLCGLQAAERPGM